MKLETKLLILIMFSLVAFSLRSWAGIPIPSRDNDPCDNYARQMSVVACESQDDYCTGAVYLQAYFNCARSLDNGNN